MSAKEVRVATPLTLLDEFAPVYQFGEFHSRRIAAPPEHIYRAVKSVTAQLRRASTPPTPSLAAALHATGA
jgi:hypothetical protein